MRKGLLRAHWLLGLFLLGALGCATDERDYVRDQALADLKEATDKLRDIHTSLREVIRIGKEKNGIRADDPAVLENLNKAQNAAADFVKTGQKAQNIKGWADRLSTKISPEAKKEMRDANRTAFEQSILTLNKTEQEVIVSLAEADQWATGDSNAAARLKALREEFQKGRDILEVLTKRR
jgi:hypothetical protein